MDMDPRYYRSLSPGSRRLSQPGRSSTGTLYPQDHDPYYAPTRLSRDFISGPRTSGERLIAPRTAPRGYRDDGVSSSRLQNEYAVTGSDYAISPRRSTLEPIPAARQPLSVIATSGSNRYRPVISSAIEKPSSPFRNRPWTEEPHYILPASSSSRRDHHRTYSADNTEPGRYLTDGRERHERAGYRSSGISGTRQGYNLNLPLVRQQKDEDDVGYEYTDRKEQMYRDTAPIRRTRRESDSGRRERPLSMTGLENYPPRLMPKSRDNRPPLTTWGLDMLDRSGSLRHEYRIPREAAPVPRDFIVSSGDEKDRSRKHRSGRSNHPAVALHQATDIPYVDEGYSPLRQDRKEPREKRAHGSRRTGSLEGGGDDRGLGLRAPQVEDRRRDPDDRSGKSNQRKPHKDRDDTEDKERHRRTHHRSDRGETGDRDYRGPEEPRKEKHRDSKAGADLALGAAGAAAAGLVAEGIKHRQHRNKEDSMESNASLPDRTKNRGGDSLAIIPDPSESSSRSGEPSDEERRERRRRRQKEKEEQDQEARGSDRRRGRNDELPPPRDEARKDSGSYGRDLRYPPQPMDVNEPRKPQSRHHPRTVDEDSYSDESSNDERRNSYHRKPSQVRIISPARDEKPEAKPKGILRPPREKFPEDPAPVREGVAPLKDAGKKGIPPNARWTKIDRKLVNPEALDQGNERYEERIDYVIVLRVLAKEEIEAYAQRTQEIRDARIREDRRRLKAIQDEEMNYERAPALRIENSPYEERDRGHGGSFDGSRERVAPETAPLQRDSARAPPPPPQIPEPQPMAQSYPPPGQCMQSGQSIAPGYGVPPGQYMPPGQSMPPGQGMPPQPVQPPSLPYIPQDSSLKEDPMRPGTYMGYQRNPPPSTATFPRPPPVPPKTAM